jgi:tetraacyldisaccharide 4'-kinase
MIREPEFWWRPDAGLGWLLAPLSLPYSAIATGRLQRPGRRVAVPVICIGNPTVGGAGKTPSALAVGQILLRMQERPFFLTRGYGGRLSGPVRVKLDSHGAREVGDEALLLARVAPTIVAHDRFAGARFAQFAGASIIVMDDGFQNPSLHKDLSLLVVDGRRGIGNGRVIPAGPLRAPLGLQLDRAQAILVVGSGAGAAPIVARARGRGLPVFQARLEPDQTVIAALGGRRVLAFAGIGDPEKFFATLAAAGVTIAERMAFPDHHRYTADDADRLLAQAKAANLVLVTTEKDVARLSRDEALAALSRQATALPVKLVVTEDEAFRAMIRAVTKPRHSGR